MLDAEETSLAAVTDDSCTVKYIEIIPLDRPADDYCKPVFIEPVVEVKPEDLQDVKNGPCDDYCQPEFIERVVEVKPEDLQDVKQEPADDSDCEDMHYSVKVRFHLPYCFSYWSI